MKAAFFKTIFLPAFWLTLLFAGSSLLFRLSYQALDAPSEIAHIPFFKLLTGLFQFALMVLLLIFSLYRSFEKLFVGSLIALIALLVLFIGLEWVVIPPTPLYVLLPILNLPLFSLFIWGFLNQKASLSIGTKYYIAFAFFLWITEWLFSLVARNLTQHFHFPLFYTLLPALFLLIVTLWFFLKVGPQVKDLPKEEEKSSFPFLSATYFFTATLIVYNLLAFIIRQNAKIEFPDPVAYRNFMQAFSWPEQLWMIGRTLIIAFLITLLLINKGWRVAATLSALLIVLVGGGFLLTSLVVPPLMHPDTFSGYFFPSQATLFLPLIQILYLHLPSTHRFRTKIVVEMILAPLMMILIVLPLMQFISVTYIPLFALLFLILLLLASRTIRLKAL